MMNSLNTPSKYTTPIGYRKDGRPIFLMAGGVDDPNNPVPVPAPSPTGPGETTFSKADLDAAVKEAVERARQQEKDKVYGRLNTLSETVQTLTTDLETRTTAEQKAREAQEEADRKAREAEMSATELLAKREQEWEQRLTETTQSFEERFNQIQQERQQEQALAAKEAEFKTVQDYRAQRLTELADDIAPEFHPFVQGNTQDEIEASLVLAKQQSDAVAAQVQAAMQAQQQQVRGTSISGYAPVGPVEIHGPGATQQYSAEEIAGMSLKEYAEKVRPHVVGGGATNRGLFG
jgi:hypothetical protein